jgi:hypothetical protein
MTGRLTVDATGRATTTLTLPGTIATFSIRAYAVAADTKLGQAETKVVSTKPVVMVPMLPRFARVGDRFQAGVTVAADDAAFEGKVVVSSAHLNATAKVLGRTSQSVALSGTTPAQVRFAMASMALGEAKFRFDAQSSSAGEDAFVDGFEVLEIQDPVTVATSMAIQANFEGAPWAESIAFPPMVPGSGSLSLTTGVGSLPAIELGAKRLFKRTIKKDSSANEWLARLTYAGVFERYQGDDSDLKGVQQEAAVGKQDALDVLKGLDDEKLGLRWTTRYETKLTDRPNLDLNLNGLYTLLRTYPSAAYAPGSAENRLAKDVTLNAEPRITIPTGPVDDSIWRDQDGDGCANYALHPQGPGYSCNYPGYEVAREKCLKTCGSPAAQVWPANIPKPAGLRMPVSAGVGVATEPTLFPSPPTRTTPMTTGTMFPPPFIGTTSTAAPFNSFQYRPVMSAQPLSRPAARPPFSSGVGRRLLQRTLLDHPAPVLVDANVAKTSSSSGSADISSTVRASSSDTALWASWKGAVEQELTRRYYDAVRYETPFTQWDHLAQTVLVLGLDWQGVAFDYVPVSGPKVPASADPAKDLSLAALVAQDLNTLSFSTQVTLAQAVLLRPQQSTPELAALVETVTSTILDSMHVQGRTAYLKVARGNSHAASMRTQSAALDVLALGKANSPLVEKLANHVRGGSNNGYSYAAQNDAEAAVCMADYDESTSSLSPNLSLKVASGASILLGAEFRGPGTTPVAVTVATSTLPAKAVGSAEPADVSFTATGSGEVSVATSMQFTPSTIAADPIYRGIFVERMVQRAEGGVATGPGVQLVVAGDFVMVTIQLTTPDDVSQVVVEDLLPAGLEAVQEEKDEMVPYPRYGGGRGGYTPPWWSSPLGSAEIRPDRVRWSANSLRAGTHSVSYRALAVTPGIFVHPPASARVESQPEVMGLSGAGPLVVAEASMTMAEQEAFFAANKLPTATMLVPKTCPEDCGAGSCNVRTGVCEEGRSYGKPEPRMAFITLGDTPLSFSAAPNDVEVTRKEATEVIFEDDELIEEEGPNGTGKGGGGKREFTGCGKNGRGKCGKNA